MPFLPVILITDGLLWLLIAAAISYAWYCQRKPHLAAPWVRVFQSKAALVCSVILLAYLGYGYVAFVLLIAALLFLVSLASALYIKFFAIKLAIVFGGFVRL